MTTPLIFRRVAVLALALAISVGTTSVVAHADPTNETAQAASGDAGIADPAEATREPELAKPSSETGDETSETPSPAQTTSPVATTVTVTPTPAAADQGSTETDPGTVRSTGPSEPSVTTSPTTPETKTEGSMSATAAASQTTPSTVGANKFTTSAAPPSQSAVERPRDTAPNAPSSPPGFVTSAKSVSYVNRSDEAQYVMVVGHGQTAGEPRRVEPGKTVTLPRCLPASTGCSFVATTTTGTQVAFHRSVARGQADPDTIALPPMTRGDGYGGGWAPTDTGVTYTNRSGHDQTLVYGDGSSTVHVPVPAGFTLPVPCAAETRCSANVGVDTGSAFINEGFVTVDETGAVIHYGTGLGNGIVQTPAGLRYSNTGQYRTIVAFSANGELEQYATVYAGDFLDLPPCELALASCEYSVFQFDENLEIRGNATSSIVNTAPPAPVDTPTTDTPTPTTSAPPSPGGYQPDPSELIPTLPALPPWKPGTLTPIRENPLNKPGKDFDLDGRELYRRKQDELNTKMALRDLQNYLGFDPMTLFEADGPISELSIQGAIRFFEGVQSDAKMIAKALGSGPLADRARNAAAAAGLIAAKWKAVLKGVKLGGAVQAVIENVFFPATSVS